MDIKKFGRTNNIIAVIILAIASFVYLSTIEPTASFWDCGEFIASSYKLEIGHPPGNPVFQLIARFFTMFGNEETAAMLVNAMSALCSAFTIFFLYLSIVHLARRLSESQGHKLTQPTCIAILGSGIVGSLAYCFSDTFWFSAVEAEVYAMSSLFTATVFWAMLKWEEEADKEYSNRWILLISFLMGLSIGVHLLNLLTIPALVFIYYFKKYSITRKGIFYVLLLSGIIIAVTLFGIIPYILKFAAWFDLFFVNVLGFGFNSGAVVFVVLLFAASFGFIYWTYAKKKVLWNTIALCFTMILIGYSTFAVVVIRSSANTPTNENQPDNPFALGSYLAREQYGSNPLIYGHSFDSPRTLDTKDYYTKLGDKYINTVGPVFAEYEPSGKMIFPRMWSTMDDNHIAFYKTYTGGKGKKIPGTNNIMPYFSDNLAFFLDYQINWMYLRYFMWNFVGRQNDLHGSTPGDLYRGNWESGIGFIDKARLGDQSVGPDYIVDSKAKNHYYFLPLILGLIGLFYQLQHDKKNWWVTLLLFILTGIAIVIYLNQPPFQVRERDYAYAGSFYAFTIWIGLSVLAIYNYILKYKIPAKIAAPLVSAICLIVPIQMASENWDDHDRSGRYTTRDLAKNYLMSCEKDAILITHGDNDTFPLWYIQEVEGYRTDIRIMNTSLMQTDWYLDQMKLQQYDSKPVDFSFERKDYLYGTNEFTLVMPKIDEVITLKEIMKIVKHPKVRYRDREGNEYMYFPTRKFKIPVYKENAVKAGIISAADSAMVPDFIEFNLSEGKEHISKPELMMLDLLSNYKWDRPISMLAVGGDLNIGIKEYLQYDGFVYTFVPFKGSMRQLEAGRINLDALYDRLMNKYEFDNLSDTTILIDYQNLMTFNGVMSIRHIFIQAAERMFKLGDTTKTLDLLNRCQQVMPTKNFPYASLLVPSYNTYASIKMISLYYDCGAKEKGNKVASIFLDEILSSIDLFTSSENALIVSQNNLEEALSYLYNLIDILEQAGDKELLQKAKDELKAIYDMFG